MSNIIYRSGNSNTIDHTPSQAINAGDVVMLGDRPLICHVDEEAGKPVGLHTGGAVYRAPKTAGDGITATAGAALYWDDTTKIVTNNDDSGNNKQIGFAVEAIADSATSFEFEHQPVS